MSVRGLLNHTVSVYRKTESVGTLRSVDASWSSAARTGLKAAIQVRREETEDDGPGDFTTGQYKGFMLAGADVQERDIIEVTAGPGSFGFLEVDEVYPPRGNHTELVLRETKEDPTA